MLADFNQICWLCLNFLYRVRKNSTPKLREGDQNKDLLPRNCMSEIRPYSATDRQIEAGNEAKPLKYSKKIICISYQFRDV